MDSLSPKDVLLVKVMTPNKFLYYGQALSVSSSNSGGLFSILPEHANFITIVEKQPIHITKTNNQVLVYNFSKAIIFNNQNQISIYAEPHSSE